MGFILPGPQKPTGLTQEAILALARKRFPKEDCDCDDDDDYDNNFPMKGRVAVITGAAGGIGGELCKVIYSLGGTVVGMDRNGDGLEELKQCLLGGQGGTETEIETGTEKNEHTTRIHTMIVNQEDLNSVSDAAEQIKTQYSKIDILVNNAGLGYPQDWISGDPRMVSAHGKDLAFTVNYLSHFLLTEKLLGHLSRSNHHHDHTEGEGEGEDDGEGEGANTNNEKREKGRIVHLTSTFHWKVDGSELLPPPKKENSQENHHHQEEDPIAFRSDPQLQGPKHVERSYANTKLAQLWHSRSIQKWASLSSSSSSSSSSKYAVSSVCACPTWAATGIAGEEARDFLQRYAFPVEDCGPGVTSAINAILRTEEELGDALDDGTSFVANSRIVEYLLGVEKWLASDLVTNTLGWRDALANVLAGVLLVGQRYTYDEFIIQRTSPESFNDEEKRDQFYQWSKKEVEKWI